MALNDTLDGLIELETNTDGTGLTQNKLARFAYTDTAYSENDAKGVTVYDENAEQNIPLGTAEIMKVNGTVLSKGWRSQASSLTRMLMNHFIGRTSYNLNKINDIMLSLLQGIQSSMGAPFGLATLGNDGKVPTEQLPPMASGTVKSVNNVLPNAQGNVTLRKSDISLGQVVNTGDSGVPVQGGQTKFTTGGAYNFFGNFTSSHRWLQYAFSRDLAKAFMSQAGEVDIWSDDAPSFYGAYDSANDTWVFAEYGQNEHALAWSTDGINKSLPNTSAFDNLGVDTLAGSEDGFIAIRIEASGQYNTLYGSKNGKDWTSNISLLKSVSYRIKFIPEDGHSDKYWTVLGDVVQVASGLNSSGSTNFTDVQIGGSASEFFDALRTPGNVFIICSDKGIYWTTDWATFTAGTGGIDTYKFTKALNLKTKTIALSTSHGIWHSSDGKAWTQVSGDTTNYTFQTGYTQKKGNSYEISVISALNHGLWWSEDGTSWTQAVGIPATANVDSISEVNGKLVAHDRSTNHFYYSTNGKSWTDSGVSVSGTTEFTSNGKMCCFAHKYTYDGINWLDNDSLESCMPDNIVSACGGFYIDSNGVVYNDEGIDIGLQVIGSKVVKANGYAFILTDEGISRNGDALASSTVDFTDGDVCFDGNMYVAGSKAGLYYSYNGDTWTRGSISGEAFTRVINTNGVWIACGTSTVAYSYDGINWTHISSLAGRAYVDMTSSGSRVLLLSGSNVYYIDLPNMITGSLSNNYSFSSVIWDGSKFVMTGSSGTYYSYDGTTLIQTSSVIKGSKIVYENNLYVIAGGMYYSEDAINWHKAFCNYETTFAGDVSYYNGHWEIISNGKVYCSDYYTVKENIFK